MPSQQPFSSFDELAAEWRSESENGADELLIMGGCDIELTDLNEWLECKDQHDVKDLPAHSDEMSCSPEQLSDEFLDLTTLGPDYQTRNQTTLDFVTNTSSQGPLSNPRRFASPAQTTPGLSSVPTYDVHPQVQINTPNSSPEDFQAEHNRILNNLTESMKRTEQSRYHVNRHKHEITQAAAGMQPSPQSIRGLARFLIGKSTSLTDGLENSRMLLQSYMAVVNNGSF
mmetsp:Transcript_30506/g.45125  ORF Transcript_30506/g.45125 Transcript_30506/m.45125 type:complete len:228 (+) Transcript_30506:107-790(+)|eukprot:CAMPEP_0195525728 /NCGR_PEP_ID=MMETSP0794_2-20130614/26319_1 /TAXON_ID=515487 /ORGANISM="Stephanopyxis turris, Strain CCMP 815" /LENGTH=227 /DNA_ID=CAMNT_0040656247 /DNA_START=102 /DNA_END=785 /DNA_ORIENTATION=+